MSASSIDIVGAGLAGLIAGTMLMHLRPRIFEIQPSLPNNHSAILRFKTRAIADATAIPFREVTLIKDNLPFSNPVADALAYSLKNTGTARSDRSIANGKVVGRRFIAPSNLIQILADRNNITYNHAYQFNSGRNGPTISTIAMPTLMKILNYSNIPKFQSINGRNICATIANCDSYVSLLVPNPELPFSRISITKDELIIECAGPEIPDSDERIALAAAELLGIPWAFISNIHGYHQRYAKIVEIDNDARKAFIWWATEKHNIYSLGRFATWRPGLQLDDLVNDIHLINRWMMDRYAMLRDR